MSDFALKTPIAIFKMTPHQTSVKDEERDLSVSTSSSSDALRSSTAATSVAEAASTSAPPLALDPVITTSLDSLFRHIVDLATALEVEVSSHHELLVKVYARLVSTKTFYRKIRIRIWRKNWRNLHTADILFVIV